MGSDIKQAASHILFSIFSPPPSRRSKTKPGENYGDDLRCLKKTNQNLTHQLCQVTLVNLFKTLWPFRGTMHSWVKGQLKPAQGVL